MQPLIQLRGVTKRYDGLAQPALDGDRPRHRGRPDHRDHGAVGRRQVDAAQPRSAASTGRRGARSRSRRPRGPTERDRGSAVPPHERRLRLPVLPPARRPERRRQHRRGRAPGRAVPRPRPTARSTSCSASSGSPTRRGSFPSTLSGGERQRVAIARAIVNRPAVLLADEPTGALDRRNGENALALLEDLNRRGQTILLVTHDERPRRRSRAHRIVRLVDGAIVGDRPRGWWRDGRRAVQDRRRSPPAAAADGRPRGRPVPGDGAATLALSILVETNEPFDHAFAAANGAHLVIDYDAAVERRAARGDDDGRRR